MPEVSRFFGIVIAIYYNDHAPPHFHAKYAGQDVSIDIEDGSIVEGSLSGRARRLVEEWRALHRDELRRDWELAQTRRPLNMIQPLE